MPILPVESCLYPEQLLSDPASEDTGGSEDSNWWVLMTRPRQEKSVARELLAKEISFYLPLVSKQNLIRGRRVRSYSPLFTGYVFLCGSDYDRVAALQTNRIAQTLRVPDQVELRNDLCQVKRLLDMDAPLTIERRLQAGRRVRIKAGAMLGLEGTVIARRSRSRLLVAVQFLQSGVSVEIDDYVLEPID